MIAIAGVHQAAHSRKRAANSERRELSVYDGARMIGSIAGCEQSWLARDAEGRALGAFPTINAAADAVSDADIGRSLVGHSG
jgi:hypothetical protein